PYLHSSDASSPPRDPLSLHDALPISATTIILSNVRPVALFLPAKVVFPVTPCTSFRASRASRMVGPVAPPFCRASLIAVIATRKDRKSTRLNSSHLGISYAVFCLKKK